MPAKDHDAYIAAAPEYARPILEKLRTIVHQAVPGVEESIKWSAPCFDHHGILAGVGAFKEHVALRLWNGTRIDDPKGLLEGIGNTEMKTIKFRSVKEVPVGELKRMLKAAAKLNEAKAAAPKGPKKKPTAKKAAKQATAKPPKDFLDALSKGARANFDAFAPGYRAEYVEWITEAKREATRAKRIAQAAEWIAEGKTRNWKYR